MSESLVPSSSVELRKWLVVSREARASITRSLSTLDKAHANIERLVEKAPRAAKTKDAPGSD